MGVLKPPGTCISKPRTWMKPGGVGGTISYAFNACETTKTLKDVQVAILLHAAGPGALEIHPHFSFAMGDAKDDYETILNKFGS